MNVSMYHAAAGMSAADRWQEVIAENMGAASIPAYKRQELSFSAIQAGLMNPGTLQPGQLAQPFALPRVAVTTNFSQGEMRFNGSKTSMAIDGQGFFEIQLPDGQSGFTRDGEFHLTASGALVTKQGFPVLGEGGPIQLDPKRPDQIAISPNGEITQGRDVKGRVKLVGFDDPQKLTTTTGGFYLATDPALVRNDQPTATVLQGAVEGSNAKPILEMAHMMNAMRSFEMNQRMLQIHDERLGKAISELGNPN
jgi:flagellar basal body rod protein FlgG